ncbi:MAG: OmpA family protein [Thermodesulfobacteriota bacterium]
MTRKTMILLVAALLVIPLLSLGLTSCAKKEEAAAVPVDEEAARKAKIEAELRERFLNEHALFDFDRYDIRPDTADVLRFKAEYMSGHPSVGVEVQGHCDERGSLQYNIALGDRRAHAAANFVESLGIDPGRMAPVTYGEEVPLDPGHDEAAWARNRRAQFVITSE